MRLARDASVDAVLLDLHLDGEDGLGALGRLQADAAAAGRMPPVVVAMTGCAEPGDVVKRRTAGLCGVLVKPFSLAQLESVLRGACPPGAR